MGSIEFIVVRWLAIFALVLAGIPRIGVGSGGEWSVDRGGCPRQVVRGGCCGKDETESCCALTGGACECEAAPIPEPAPRPATPLTPVERVPLTAVASSGAALIASLHSGWGEKIPGHGRPGILEGLTHNEVRASLGNWRT